MPYRRSVSVHGSTFILYVFSCKLALSQFTADKNQPSRSAHLTLHQYTENISTPPTLKFQIQLPKTIKAF